MNGPFNLPIAPAVAGHICRRVIDALLRENVRGCLSRGTIVSAHETPFASQLSAELHGKTWLRVAPFGEGTLWLAVESSRFMQDWRLRALPAVWCSNGQTIPRYTLTEILACFREGLDPESRDYYKAFEDECRVAEEHGVSCEAERARWFAAPDDGLANWPDWARSLLRHDWLASFHDHPFYPTARAKLGFSVADLRAYAPEFRPSFLLRWLAVPRALYQGVDLPAELRPGFADIGLDPALAESHALLPVHPAMWENALEEFLVESGLAKALIRAPKPWLAVTPTLSVRTVVPLDSPHLHLKLPLSMRTLGTRNLRTIKPSTIADGAAMQSILASIVDEPDIASRLLLTNEDTGASVDGKPFLGFILRRYPDRLDHQALAPVAALTAPAPDSRLVIEGLAERYYAGDVLALFEGYLDLTLRLHLTLWIRYGIALESNQQNSIVVFSDDRLRLLLKDNDAARLHGQFLARRRPDYASRLDRIIDRRMIVDEELPLAQMFITITLQLNIAVLIEALADVGRGERDALYRRVRDAIARILDTLAAEGEDVSLARRILLEDKYLPLKYLLRAASLESKTRTGASDVNKFYGTTAPNFLSAP